MKAKKTIPEFRMTRKIERNILRNKVGNKGLRQAWRNNRISKYGYMLYQRIRKFNIPSKKLYNMRKVKLEF